MATQHPDNAGTPWWGTSPFISTQDEVTELLELFQNLPIDEYMWDWEGKFVDESVGERIFLRAHEFFKERVLGRDLYLTYRIPAWEQGKSHRMARSFMNVLSLADLAHEIKLPQPPVTEFFLPLCTSADQLLAVRSAFREVADYHRLIFHGSAEEERVLLSLVRVTPLVEDVDSLFSIEKILEPYWSSLVTEDGSSATRGQRVFVARSDPAMNSGVVPAVLALKSALSTVHGLGERFGFPVYPLIGTGSLPFRGGVHPGNEHVFLPQYAGIHTYSIQSAFRYDYPKEEVRHSLERLHAEVKNHKVGMLSDAEKASLRSIADTFVALWKPTIEGLAPTINELAKYVPARRERLQHIGLFGYSRGVGNVTLPRAITFTCTLYSLGIPPELISTGRGLAQAKKDGSIGLIEKHYTAMKHDLQRAARYFNSENLELLAKRDAAFAGIVEDVKALKDVLGLELGPRDPEEVLHRNLTSNILQRLLRKPEPELITRDIVEAATLRRSLG